MLSFEELCSKPVAAADYIALAQHYHSVAISGVPIVTAVNRPAAYRFMILIDMLYEHKCVSQCNFASFLTALLLPFLMCFRLPPSLFGGV